MFLQCVDGKTRIQLARLTGSNCNLEEIDLKLTKTAHNTLLPDMIVENEIGGKNGNLPNSWRFVNSNVQRAAIVGIVWYLNILQNNTKQ